MKQNGQENQWTVRRELEGRKVTHIALSSFSFLSLVSERSSLYRSSMFSKRSFTSSESR